MVLPPLPYMPRTVGQISRVTDTRNDIRFDGHLLVHRRRPQGHMLHRQPFLDILHAVGRRNYGRQMSMERHSSLFEQRIVGHLNRGSCGQHRVHDNQHFSLEVGGSDLFEDDFHGSVLAVLSECRHKSVRGVVKDVQEAVVHGNPRPQNRGYHHLVARQHHLSLPQRGHYGLLLVVQRLANLVGNHLTAPLQVAPKAHRVALGHLVAHLCHVTRQYRVLLVQYLNHGRRNLLQ